MQITAEMVRSLREQTGLPMMECKSALAEAAGDVARAKEILRKKVGARIEKMQTREASEGRIAVFVDSAAGRAGIVELRCETAPVASTADFAGLARLIARVASMQDSPTPESVRAAPVPGESGRTVDDEFKDVFNRIRENMTVARVGCLRGHVGSYEHFNAQVGVLVEMSGDCPEALRKDVSMHVCAARPRCVRRDEVAPEEVAREREIAAEAAKGKPAPVIDKIVAGKLDRWFAEFVLLEQPFVKDDKRSVGEVLRAAAPDLTVRRFLRFEVGGA